MSARDVDVEHALPAQDERTHEQQERDEARHRIARQADERGTSRTCAERERLAGLHRDLPHLEPALGLHRRLDVVLLADRHAAGRDDQVGADRGAGEAPRACAGGRPARCRGRAPRSPASPAARAARSGWSCRSRPGGSGSPGITSSSPVKNTATRSRRCTVSVADADRRGQPEVLRPSGACRPRAPSGPPRCPRPARRIHAPAAGFSLIVTSSPFGDALLLHHDRVGARRHRRAGEDACGRAGLERRAHVPGGDALATRAASSAPPARRATRTA